MAPSWRRSPFVRIALAFLGGCMAGIAWLPVHGTYAPLWCAGGIVMLCGIASLLRYSFHARYMPGVFIFTALAALGFLYCGLHLPSYHHNHYITLPPSDCSLARITDVGKCDSTSVRCYADAMRMRVNGEWRPATGRLSVQVYQTVHMPKPGDLLLIRAERQHLPLPRYPLGFNYSEVMEDKAIYAGIRGGQDHAVWAMSESISIPRMLYQWRETLKSRIDRYVRTTEAQGILHALLLGDSRAMDQEIMQSYSRSGTIHILAVSGLHVGMIYLLISFVFGKLLLRNSWPVGKMIIQAVLLWIYAGLTGFSPSVSRSAVMCTFFIIAATGKKQSNAINTLAASAVLQAAHDPLCLLSLGFQLSYLAVLGILLLQRPIELLLFFRNRTLLSVWKLSSVSLAAQLTTLPLTVFVFRQFPVYFLLANLLMIPISTVILYLGVLFLCVSGIPPAAAIAGKTMEFLVGVMNAAATKVSALPGALLSGFHLDTASAMGITLLIVLFSDFLITKRKNRIMPMAALVTFLVSWSAFNHFRHDRLREVLLAETRDGLTLVYTSDGRSHLWTQSPGETVQPMHPLEPYLSYLGTTVKYGLLELPEQAIWTKITPPHSADTLLIILPKINDVRIELSEWKRVSHHPVVFSSKVRRGVQKYLTSQAADSTRVLGNLRETSWIYKEGGWHSSLEVYPP